MIKMRVLFLGLLIAYLRSEARSAAQPTAVNPDLSHNAGPSLAGNQTQR